MAKTTEIVPLLFLLAVGTTLCLRSDTSSFDFAPRHNNSQRTTTHLGDQSYFCQYFKMKVEIDRVNKQLLVFFSWKHKTFSTKMKFRSYRLPIINHTLLSCQGCSSKKWIVYHAELADSTGRYRQMIFNISLSVKTRHLDCRFRMGSHKSDNLCVGQVRGVATVPDVHTKELPLLERMDDATRYKIIGATAGSVVLLMLLMGLVSYIIHRILHRVQSKPPPEEEHLGFFSPIDERVDRLYERYM